MANSPSPPSIERATYVLASSLVLGALLAGGGILAPLCPWDYPDEVTLLTSLGPATVLYNLFYMTFIIFFCYFYTAVIFNPADVADNMKKYGGYIPGIRPGKKTSDYIDRVLTRITLGGAIYIAAVCVLPSILIYRFNIPFYFGGTALLIVVGVAMDTVSQMESHMLSRHYEGFMKKGQLKGRR